MRRLNMRAGVTALAATAVAAGVASLLLLTGASDPAQTGPEYETATRQAADASRLLREIEVTEDVFVAPCMAEAGFTFFSVPLNATPQAAQAIVASQNAYVASLDPAEQARFEATLGTDEVPGCLGQARETVARDLPANTRGLAMAVQLDSVGEFDAVVEIQGERPLPASMDANERSQAYDRAADEARSALAAIRARN